MAAVRSRNSWPKPSWPEMRRGTGRSTRELRRDSTPEERREESIKAVSLKARLHLYGTRTSLWCKRLDCASHESAKQRTNDPLRARLSCKEVRDDESIVRESRRRNAEMVFGRFRAALRLKEGGAAVDVDGLARDGAGLVRAEEEGSAGDFIGGLAAALKNGVEKTGELFFFADVHFLREHRA